MLLTRGGACARVIAAGIEAGEASIIGGPLEVGPLDLATADPNRAAVAIIATR